MASDAELVRRAADLMAAALVTTDDARLVELAEASSLVMADIVSQRTGILGDLLPVEALEMVRDEVLALVRDRLLSVATSAAPAMAAATSEEEITAAFHEALAETLALKH